MFSWLSPEKFPIIVAHRGSSAIAPENTLAAFRQAITDGADAVELDVHLSKDGEVVVIHDETLRRTTDGKGKVSDYTLKELKRLSAGRWFHKTFASESIPTLSEVLALLHHRTGVNIEIKGYSSRRYDIVERCIDTINAVRAVSTAMISSFHYPYVLRAKMLCPSVATGLLYHPVHQLARSPSSIIRSMEADFFIMNSSSLRKRIVQSAHRKEIMVGEYTVDTKKRGTRSLRFGVDVIYTNKPEEIRTIMSDLK